MRAIAWVKERGAEFAEIDLGGTWLRATGVAVGGDPVPYRLEYELDCGDGLVTRRLSVRAWGAGWGRHLELTRDPVTGWSAGAGADGEAELLGLPGVPGLPPPGGDPETFATALDCDLGLPGTGGPVSLIRFESGDFSAGVAFDAQGMVVDYPGIDRLA